MVGMDGVSRVYRVGVLAAVMSSGSLLVAALRVAALVVAAQLVVAHPAAAQPAAAEKAQPLQLKAEVKPSELPPRPPPAKPVLCEPANAGDLNKVQTLLRKGADLNAVDSLKRTPLMLALARADVSGPAAPLKGVTPEKREANKLKIARLLIERGADVDKRSEIGLTALHYAAMWPGDEGAALELTRALVQKGAIVDPRMETGVTPLRMAVDRKRVQIARFLVESGADPLGEDDDQQSPYRRARALKSPDLIAALTAPLRDPQQPATQPPAGSPAVPAQAPSAPAKPAVAPPATPAPK